ncbi:hypothetical protein CspeluHIS016_0101940 [Cutaneotrichosporon spelunceum]|uniref:Uncharacterized protein n=1 Tax=Cutaneotrichosporon spelunceum TaxID=1672016 RepID=A0AAD3TM40_9TREE|nr:hypothetical protein CspeluHIS016_0101940 [Cutaneotrichosporon spelunceum]
MSSATVSLADAPTSSPIESGFISITSTRPVTTGAPFTGGGGPPTPNLNSGSSTQMYLFTFLATVCALSIVAIVLLWRAIYVRRRFHRQVVEAIARGEPPPPNLRSPFIARYPQASKKKVELGPMPRMWECEMRRTDWDVEKGEEVEDDWDGDEWQDVVPVSVVSVPGPEPEPEPEPASQTTPPVEVPRIPTMTEELRDTLRDMLPLRSREGPRSHVPPSGDAIEKAVVGEVPEPGTALRVGVLIAMPCSSDARWKAVDPEKCDVPEVKLGVMECIVGEGHSAGV